MDEVAGFTPGNPHSEGLKAQDEWSKVRPALTSFQTFPFFDKQSHKAQKVKTRRLLLDIYQEHRLTWNTPIHRFESLDEFPVLLMHLQRMSTCGAQGHYKFCPSCGKVHLFKGSCSSALHHSCAKIESGRLKRIMKRTIPYCQHHYGVFNLPSRLRTWPTEYIEKRLSAKDSIRRAQSGRKKRLKELQDLLMSEACSPAEFNAFLLEYRQLGVALVTSAPDFIKRVRITREDKLLNAVRRVLKTLLGKSTKDKWWGAWAAPHRYASADLRYTPHVNVVFATETHLKGGRLSKRVPYRNLRQLFVQALRKEFKTHVALSELSQPKFVRKSPTKVIEELLDYCKEIPLPKHIKVLPVGLLHIKIPHGKKNHPSFEIDPRTFLERLDKILPPHHYRTIRKWGVYGNRHKLYKDKPFQPFDEGLPEDTHCKCGEVLHQLCTVGRHYVVHVDPVLKRTTWDFEFSGPVLSEFIQALIDSMNNKSVPPKWSDWHQRLADERRATQNDLITLDSGVFKLAKAAPEPLTADEIELLFKHYSGGGFHKKSSLSSPPWVHDMKLLMDLFDARLNDLGLAEEQLGQINDIINHANKNMCYENHLKGMKAAIEKFNLSFTAKELHEETQAILKKEFFDSLENPEVHSNLKALCVKLRRGDEP